MSHDKSKVVFTQLAWGTFARSALSSHGTKAIQALTTVLGGQHPSYAEDALRARFATYDAILSEANEELERAEAYYVQEHNEDTTAGNARDVSMARVEATLDRLRRTFTGIFEQSWLPAFGLDVSPPPSALGVAEYGRGVVEKLRAQASIEDAFGREVSLRPFADALVMPLDELEQACRKLHGETREVQRALTGRHNAQERWKRSYRHIAGILSAEFDMAGFHELARLLRPTIRRVTGIEDPSAPDASEVDDF